MQKRELKNIANIRKGRIFLVLRVPDPWDNYTRIIEKIWVILKKRFVTRNWTLIKYFEYT